MKALIIYDSYYGNTESIAKKYTKLLIEFEPTLMKVNDVTQIAIDSCDILIIGSPTRVFNMSGKINRMLKRRKILDKHIFVFDTRIDSKNTKGRFLPSMMYKLGYAAEKIQKKLLDKGNQLIMDFAYYYCDDYEGPVSNSFEAAFLEDSKNLLEKIKMIHN